MKKCFAVFCAVFLLPMFSAQAWIGGPFSDNSFFGENGDDGVYEAVATTQNGIGIYRIVVGNEFEGVNPDGVTASVPNEQGVDAINTITVPAVASGNVIIGGLGSSDSNIWFFEGTSYFGRSIGTVNSALGQVVAVGEAEQGIGGNVTLRSGFRGRLENTGDLLPATSFRGSGQAELSNGQEFEFSVFGSKVSNQITFGL